ncbi:MAG: GNAT family N-acetyltransferase [Erysipelotrichaceae bacterium]|nr:GNAT family N-acetyltransferase [Erysipelotrichaceae bacterium]
MSEFRLIREDELEKIMQLQKDCFAALENHDWLRCNDEETFRLCLKRPNYSLGFFDGDRLAAIGILQICGLSEENLGRQLGFEGEKLNEVGNMKLVLVDPAYRGKRLQHQLMDRCEEYARQQKLRVLATTVHPDNAYSIHNVEKSGYVYHSRHRKYGGLIRNLYYKNL